MKTALSRRFDSRINWDLLGVTTQAWQGAKVGDKRLVGGIWHEFDGLKWVKDTTTKSSALDVSRYGVSTFWRSADRVPVNKRDSGFVMGPDIGDRVRLSIGCQ